MGPIYDRTREHLGSSDLAITRFRRFMIEAASRDAQGEGPAPALGNDFEYGEIRAGEALIGRDEPWQTAVGSRGQAQVDAP
jgi:phthalate 4,5-dioxygenase oxygenase subunit